MYKEGNKCVKGSKSTHQETLICMNMKDTHTLNVITTSCWSNQSPTTSRFTRYDDLPDVITIDTGDQHLALVVVDEESSDHVGALTQCSQAMLENWIKRRSKAVSHWMGNSLKRLSIVYTLVLADIWSIAISSVSEIADTQYYRANLFNYLLSFIARKWTNSSVRLKEV